MMKNPMKTFIQVFALALLFNASAALADAQGANGVARQRITTASGVRVRERPDTNTEELARLQVGIVVEELERSQDKT